MPELEDMYWDLRDELAEAQFRIKKLEGTLTWYDKEYRSNYLRVGAEAEAQARIAELEKALYEIAECTSIEGALEVVESFGLLDPNSDARKRYERLRLSRKELDKQGKEFLRSYKPEAVEGLSVKKE